MYFLSGAPMYDVSGVDIRRLSRIADHKAGIRVRQVKSEEVDLALYAPR